MTARTTLAVVLLLAALGAAQSSDWPQFGGPHRNFVADAPVPAPWTAKGPREIWSRPLGEGYSAISLYQGKLYTMYRAGDKEVAIALDAATGKTVWEFTYNAPLKGYNFAAGPGPHASPLVTADRVFIAGTTGLVHALDRETGKAIWMHDVIAEYHGTLRDNGYACSPLAYGDTIIMMIGGKDESVVAFKQSDGEIAWRTPGFENSSSSPVLIRNGGEEQVLAFLYKDIVSLDPKSGKVLWSFPHETEFGLNVALPLYSADDNLLFLSSAYTGGSRLLKLNKAKAEEEWYSRRLRIHFTNAMRLGDRFYGSSGDMTAVFTALDAKTGKIVWQDRAVGRAEMLRVGDHLILLDEEGNLILATPGDNGLKIEAKAQIFDGQSWTPPTLSGSTLYVRDRKMIKAFDLKP